MSGATPAHWDAVYGARAEDALTWFEADPALSIDLARAHLRPGDPVLDLGGGTSRFVDRLLAAGLGPVTVIDLSEAALSASRDRLGPRASEVTWHVGDIRDGVPGGPFALWHDRAAFHFLTDPDDRAAYAAVLSRAVRPGGTAIVATFAPDGPATCSGLPVMRYTPESLLAELAPRVAGRMSLVEGRRHTHVTPKGARQHFQASVLRLEREGA